MRSVLLLAVTACSPPARSHVDDTGSTDVGPQCTGAMDCMGNTVVACNADGTFGDIVMDCGGGKKCQGGQCVTACTADGVDLIYVVSAQLDFLSFDPRLLPADPFTRIGTLACPTTLPNLMNPMNPPAPFSMGVDRDGIAWVLYTSGEVFNVKISDASCTATTWVPKASGMELFGMGFVTDTPATSSEKLYIVGGSRQADPGGNLAVVDTHAGNYTPTIIGEVFALSDVTAELTGTNEAKLYGFFPRVQVRSYVQQFDVTNALTFGPSYYISNGGLGPIVRDWAFAQFAGSFYEFVTTSDGMTDNSTVRVVDRSTGVYSELLSMLPYSIVGAGVSTCAPTVVQ
jgi:hypothetical protein